MFNLGIWEIIVLAVIALVVVGPERLPKLARDVGRFLNDIKRTTSNVAQEISHSIDEQEFMNPKTQDDQLSESAANDAGTENTNLEDAHDPARRDT